MVGSALLFGMLSAAAAGLVRAHAVGSPVAAYNDVDDAAAALNDRTMAFLAALAAQEEAGEQQAMALVAPPELAPDAARPPMLPPRPPVPLPVVRDAPVLQPLPGEQNPLASPHSNGPIGPSSRHQRGIVCLLEYPDYNPNDPPPEFVGLPRRPPNPALYLAYCQAMLQSPHMYCASFQPEIAAGGLHHVQFYYADTRRKPTLGQQYVVWAFRGVPLRPWQYRSFASDNPRGAWEYAIKGADWRDRNGQPDTGVRMPGGVPRTFGLPPPPGEIQRGGNRERGNNDRNDPANNEMVQLAQYVRQHAVNKRQYRDLYLDPQIVSKLKPTESLVQNMHSAFNEPDMTPNLRFKRRVYIITGASGSGKTFSVTKWCHKYGIDLWVAQTPKDGLYGGFMQGYTGQRAVLFDECDGNFTNFDTFLKLTHSHEGRFDKKTTDCVWRPEFVFITSMTLPKDWTWYIGGSTKRRRLERYDTEKKPFYRRLDYGGIYIWGPDDDHTLVQPMAPAVTDLSPVPNKYYEVIRTAGYMPIPHGAGVNYPRTRWPDVLKGELSLGDTPGTNRHHVQEPTYLRTDLVAAQAARVRKAQYAAEARVAREAEEARIVALETAEAAEREADRLAAQPAPAEVVAPPVVLVAPPVLPPVQPPRPEPMSDEALAAELAAHQVELEERFQPAQPRFDLQRALDEVDEEEADFIRALADPVPDDAEPEVSEDSDAQEARLETEDREASRRRKRVRQWIADAASDEDGDAQRQQQDDDDSGHYSDQS